MVESDGTDATEVLSLEELRGLAAAEGYETGGLPAAPRKANSDDIAAAEAPSAPKQWNPQPAPHPHQRQWGGEFGAAGQAAASQPQAVGPVQSPAGPDHAQPGTGRPAGPGYGQAGHAPAYSGAYAAGYAPGGPVGPGGAGGPGGPGGPAGPGGPGNPGGPHDPYGRRGDTKKVPAWLWVLAAIALILALGIVG